MYAQLVHSRQRAIEEVSRFCDLTERLSLVPPSAAVRGIYFRSIETVLEHAGLIERFRALFPDTVATMRWAPVSEFLIQLTVGAALLKGPERVHEGMFEIGCQNARIFAESLLGKIMLRLLSRDPRKLLEQAVAGRRQSYNVGHWELRFADDYTAVMRLVEEYCYLESYMLGAAQGTFEAAGIPVIAEAKLEDRFTGTHTLRWGPAIAAKRASG